MRLFHAVLAFFLVLVPLVAEAQAPGGSTPYVRKVREGVEAVVASNLDAGIAAFEEAIRIDPTFPEAHYYLGEAQRMKGELEAAVVSFRNAAQRAAQQADLLFQARSLHAVAQTLEQIPEKAEEARLAWNEAMSFGTARRQVYGPEIAQGRMQIIEALQTQERAYVAVRERIAARAAQQATPNRPGR